MKEKIVIVVVAAIVAVGAAWNLNQKADNNALSDLTLSNVEALAMELNGGIGWRMALRGEYFCCTSGGISDVCFGSYTC